MVFFGDQYLHATFLHNVQYRCAMATANNDQPRCHITDTALAYMQCQLSFFVCLCVATVSYIPLCMRAAVKDRHDTSLHISSDQLIGFCACSR